MYELRDQILQLNRDERTNLLAMLEHEESKAAFVPGRADDELWNALVKFSPPGTVPQRSLGLFLRDKTHGVTKKAWTDAVETLAVFAEQVEPVRHRDQDRAALVDLAIECLAAELERRDERVNPKALIEALPRLHSAIDRAFPGYIEAGLLHRLIRLAAEPVEAE